METEQQKKLGSFKRTSSTQNFLVLKVVLLAIKEFEPLCKGQVVLVATIVMA